MPKRDYPGGFRLTKKTAETLAVQELGTARGLRQAPGMFSGYFRILIGNLGIEIFPENGLIVMQIGVGGYGSEKIKRFFWPDTLEHDYDREDEYRRKMRREDLKEWIGWKGPEKCKAEIENLWLRMESGKE